MPLGMAMTAIGYSGPVASALLMTFTMTAPMIVWMRVRGHTWERAGEMGAAMVIPSIALIVLSLFGVIAQSGLANAVMIPMIPAMVAAMLYRRTEYAHCGSHREVAPSVS
jgi:flagellar biosynthetic protein FliP